MSLSLDWLRLGSSWNSVTFNGTSISFCFQQLLGFPSQWFAQETVCSREIRYLMNPNYLNSTWICEINKFHTAILNWSFLFEFMLLCSILHDKHDKDIPQRIHLLVIAPQENSERVKRIDQIKNYKQSRNTVNTVF